MRKGGMSEESKLCDRLSVRDPEMFGMVFQQHRYPLRGFLRQYTGTIEAAEDLVQETFLQLWRRPTGFDPQRGTLKQYLFGIARNLALQWQRRCSASNRQPASESFVPDNSQSVMLRNMFQHLDQEHRAVLWLRDVEGYSYAELAQILGIPEGTVKSRLFVARETLRKIW